jgi:hypothetical protein
MKTSRAPPHADSHHVKLVITGVSGEFLVLYLSLTKPPIFESSLCVTATCNYRYINQL